MEEWSGLNLFDGVEGTIHMLRSTAGLEGFPKGLHWTHYRYYAGSFEKTVS